jgi:hypothetical protein
VIDTTLNSLVMLFVLPFTRSVLELDYFSGL